MSPLPRVIPAFSPELITAWVFILQLVKESYEGWSTNFLLKKTKDLNLDSKF